MTEWKCKCNKVIIKFDDKPFMCNNCHCTYCCPIASFIDKNSDSKNISAIIYNTGVAKAMFSLKQIKEFIGKDLLKPIKFGKTSENIRAYTSCCNTLCICDGGKKLGFSFRPFNRNCLYNLDGSKYIPLHTLIWNTQGGDNTHYENIPEPKHMDLPPHLLTIVEREIKKDNYGIYKTDTSPGFYCDPNDCDTYVML